MMTIVRRLNCHLCRCGLESRICANEGRVGGGSLRLNPGFPPRLGFNRLSSIPRPADPSTTVHSPGRPQSVRDQEMASLRLKDHAVVESADTSNPSAPAKSCSTRVPPPLLILDLNGSLVHRQRTLHAGAWKKTVVARPHLDEFFEYILGTHTAQEDGKTKTRRTWEVIVWSSAMSHSVDSMCKEIKISKRTPGRVRSRTVGGDRLSDHFKALDIKPDFSKTKPVERAVLDIWNRSMLDLDPSDFHQKVQTTKDLRKVWKKLVWTDPESGERHRWGPENTVIVDDNPDKLSLQPDNLYQIKEFTGDSNDTELLKLVEFLKAIRNQSDIPAAIKAAKEAKAPNS